jgi:hypothetical protein
MSWISGSHLHIHRGYSFGHDLSYLCIFHSIKGGSGLWVSHQCGGLPRLLLRSLPLHH